MAASAAAAYIPPSFGQPGVSISYRPKRLTSAPSDDASLPTSPVVTVAVPPASIHHIFAHRQWRAGMLMSDALVSRAFPIEARNVLELGAGTGLPSITAAQLHTAKVVVASDYDEPALMRELKQNVAANMAASPADVRRTIKVASHIWGKNTDDLLDCLPAREKFDSVLLADCLWDPLSHADLLKTVVAVLARTPDARVNVIAGLHTGRDKVTSFIRRAARAGLVLAEVEAPQAWPALSEEAETEEDPDASRPGNEALALARERILELKVCGNTPIQHGEAETEARTDDEPRLTGERRPFRIEGYGETTEGDVKLRNRWLTVWSLAWAAP